MNKSRVCEDCNCESCVIATDAFDRADSTDLGANWREVAGSWEILSEELTTASADAFARHLVPHPDGEFFVKVSAFVKGADVGDQLRVMGPVWGDDDFLFVELTIGAECGTLQLFRSDGGVITELSEATAVYGAVPDKFHLLSICYQEQGSYYSAPSLLVGKVQTASTGVGTITRWMAAFVDLTGETPDADGVTGGVGTGDLTADAYFDDFRIEKAKSTLHPECPDCPLCIVQEDLFQTLDLSCEWDILSGTWTTGSGSGALTCTASGTIISEVLHPYDDHWWLSVGVNSAAAGDTVRILADYNPVDGSCIYAEMVFGNLGPVSLKFFDGSSTTTLATSAAVVTSPTGLRLILDGGVAVLESGVATSIQALYAVRGYRHSGITVIAQATVSLGAWLHGINSWDLQPDCYGRLALSCDVCEDSSVAPQHLVELTGTWTDIPMTGNCSDCTRMNNKGVIVRPFVASEQRPSCHYNSTLAPNTVNPCIQFFTFANPPPPALDDEWPLLLDPPFGDQNCFPLTVELSFVKVGANYIIRLKVWLCGGPEQEWVFEKNYGTTKPKCLLLSEEALTLVSSNTANNRCGWNSPGVLISAIY